MSTKLEAIALRTEVTDDDMKKLRHMLGATEHRPKENWGFRNYFAAGPGHSDEPHLESLVSKGLMTKRRDVFDEMHESYLYHVTDQGRQKVMESHPNILQHAKG